MQWRKLLADKRKVLVEKESSNIETLTSFKERLAALERVFERKLEEDQKQLEEKRRRIINLELVEQSNRKLQKRIDQLEKHNLRLTKQCNQLKASLDETKQASTDTSCSTILVQMEIEQHHADISSVYVSQGMLADYRQLVMIPQKNGTPLPANQYSIELVFE